MPCNRCCDGWTWTGAGIIAAIGCAAGLIDLTGRPITLTNAPLQKPEPTPEPAAPPPPPPQGPQGPSKPVEPAPLPKPTTHPDGEGFITLEQARSMFMAGTATFIDARNPPEHEEACIPNSLNIPPEAFLGGAIPDALYAVSHDQPLVIYCSGGDCDASILVAVKIRETRLWRADIVVFKEGIKGWVAAGLPTVTLKQPGIPGPGGRP